MCVFSLYNDCNTAEKWNTLRFQTKHGFSKQKNGRFIFQIVWNKIELSIKFKNFQSLNFLRSKRRVKVTSCPSVLYSDLDVRKKFWFSLSNIWSSFYISNFLLICLFLVTLKVLLKIETRLSLECDIRLFFSRSHQHLKYLTKTVSPINR